MFSWVPGYKNFNREPNVIKGEEAVSEKIDRLIKSAQDLELFIETLNNDDQNLEDKLKENNEKLSIDQQVDDNNKIEQQPVEQEKQKGAQKIVDIINVELQKISGRVATPMIEDVIEKVLEERKKNLQEAIISLFENSSPSTIFSYDKKNPKRVENFIRILTCDFIWPDKNEKIQIKDVANLKEVLFNSICQVTDDTIKINALLQSISPQTFLGRIFYIKRGFCEPELNAGSLKKIATTLNLLLEPLENRRLYADTEKVLLSEYFSNQKFGSDVHKYFYIEQTILSAPNFDNTRGNLDVDGPSLKI